MSVAKKRYVYRPSRTRSGKWIVRKVLWKPDRYDTYSSMSDALLVCKRNVAGEAHALHIKKRRDMRDRLVNALSQASLEDLEIARDLVVGFWAHNRWD